MKFVIHLFYTARSLRPHSTILCRIDTLEKPSLLPSCLGYAFLKLCVNSSGQQPSGIEPAYSMAYLNSGEFSLQVFHGRIPDGQLREDAIGENMCPIPGALLKVRLFDSRQQVDADSRWTWKSKSSLGSGITTGASKISRDLDEESEPATSRTQQSNSHKGQAEVSIAESLLRCALTRPSGGKGLEHPLPIDARQALRILTERAEEDEALGRGEEEVEDEDSAQTAAREQLRRRQQRNHSRMEVLEAVSRYVEAVFPRLEEVRTLVNPIYMMSYDSGQGSLLALDMLYNMPNRKNLIKAADEATIVLAIRQGMSSGWDNKIKYFKTVFRYLPGTDGPSNSSSGSREVHSDTDFIIDDASVRPVLSSHELSPMFMDEFSCTANLNLTSRACLLVQVTAVDVLTSSKSPSASNSKEASRDLVSTAASGPSPPFPSHSRNNSLSGEESSEALAAQAKKSERWAKLKGLIGIYIGHNDAESTWWGLLPLHTSYPRGSSRTSSGTNSNTSAGGGGGGGARGGGERGGQAEGGVEGDGEGPVFVNAGTHLVPLFKGLPPDELISAADPMSWLLAALRRQRRTKKKASLYSTIFSKLAWSASSSSAPSPAPSPDLTLRRGISGSSNRPASSSTMSIASAIEDEAAQAQGGAGGDLLVLCKGSSAVVRVVDARLRKLANPPIALDASLCPSHRTLVRILRAYCARVTGDGEDSAEAGSPVAPRSPFPFSGGGSGGHAADLVDERKFNRNFARFSFNPLRNSEDRTLAASIPLSMEPDALFQEINEQFCQTVE